MSGAIILAAGASSRLGSPKQLLMHRGKSLLQHAIDAALSSGASQVIVVLGAAFDEVRPTIGESPVMIVENTQWQRGIGTGIAAGMRSMMHAAPGLTELFILLCDQPYVSGPLLRDMQALSVEAGKGIVACEYDETLGVPLLVGREYFGELLALPDARGAKVLLAAHPADVIPFSFPQGAKDVDTMEDYKLLEEG